METLNHLFEFGDLGMYQIAQQLLPVSNHPDPEYYQSIEINNFKYRYS